MPAPRLRRSPAQLASAVEAVITMLTDGAAIDAVYNGPNGLLSGDVKGKLFIEMSTVPPKVRDRLSRRKCAPRARPCRMSCRRLDRAGAAGQAARPDGCGAPPTRSARKPILEQLCRKARTLRAGRRRLVDEARDQSAADGRLAGLWRGFRHCALGRLGAEAAARPFRRYQWRKSRDEEPRRDDCRRCWKGATPGRRPSASPMA